MAGEVAFEAADGFSFGFAFGCFSVEVEPGGGIGSCSAEGDDVDRSIELAVAAAVQSVATGVTGAGGNRGGSGVSGERGLGGEALRACRVADQDRGGDSPAAALSQQLGLCSWISPVSSASSSDSWRLIWEIRVSMALAIRTWVLAGWR